MSRLSVSEFSTKLIYRKLTLTLFDEAFHCDNIFQDVMESKQKKSNEVGKFRNPPKAYYHFTTNKIHPEFTLPLLT